MTDGVGGEEGGSLPLVDLGVGSEVKPNPIPNFNTCRVVV